jgi:Ca2+-binding EF-hand superfamily protein
MGGCMSAKYAVNVHAEGQGIDCQKALSLLKLNDEEINRIYRCFVKFDLSGDGKLSIVEFLTMLDIGESFIQQLSPLNPSFPVPLFTGLCR